MLPSNFSWYLNVIILSDISTYSNLFTHCKGTEQDYKLGMGGFLKKYFKQFIVFHLAILWIFKLHS